MKKVSVIGHFGGTHICLDGQTVKTKTLTEQLENEYTAAQVLRFDTCGGRVFVLKLPFVLLSALKNSQNIVILPAQNGLRVIAPLLAGVNRLFHRRLHYVVIGGWLPQMLEKRKLLSRVLKRFDHIYVETAVMRQAMEAQGFDNVIVMPNCKALPVLQEDELVYPTGTPYHLCTFSRVMKEKGIEDAVAAVQKINEKYNRTVFTLDIYGQVDSQQTGWFERLRQSFPLYVTYCGIVDFNESVQVVKNYFALLFLTYYQGEGFAGTLLDAMAAGVPIIATDWKYNAELINKDNGFLVGIHDVQSVISHLDYLMKQDIRPLKQSCLREYERYRPETVIQILTENF